ncbi:MAG: hypothetical protein GY820_44680 [Gammaproteobacteria bacterium]|nr:hypothetical protein [Gammaproteobacteria bacterium]
MTSHRKIVDRYLEDCEHVYNSFTLPALTVKGFKIIDSDSRQKLFLDRSGVLKEAKYNYAKWESPRLGSVTWFLLASDIPHLSSINALLGLPNFDTSEPYLVMNLNMKLQHETFSIIGGYRDYCNLGYGPLLERKLIDKCRNKPIALHKNPEGFYGVRDTYDLNKKSISIGLQVEKILIQNWLDLLGGCKKNSTPTLDSSQKYRNNFKKELMHFHISSGSVFDRAFGKGWVEDVFQKALN